ncbi:MAG: tRNA (N(6)-L-threonylcarbamoyladenosine(37)-C(2))-methylthiotransferase MtaB [Treponema sp.]|jgi:threonylcarbamoyladenosine tRNA methylthiotransferase MtaB|nr:tRNA (N(6)-L-threonylcarbamoyladenosine(37)-C(2))-methylthiotransferase MtaB [Treponema sp.]
MPFDAKKWPVAVYTLGCKLNQLESESIADAFRKEGFFLAESTGEESGASILIVNTCTVTSKSEQKARRVIRKALRENSELILIVTGCYAQLEAEALESLDTSPLDGSPKDSSSFGPEKRLFVILGDSKDRLLELPHFLAASGSAETDFSGLRELVSAWVLYQGQGRSSPASADDPSFNYRPDGFSFHSRSFLKIQDGCDNHCSYCRTRIARGKTRSLEASEVLDCLRSLEEKGYEEAVLTGVNISQYLGKSKEGFLNLAELLEYLVSETKSIRIRLSSIEPEPLFFSPAFIKAVSHKRIRPHFHLSLQSASSVILKRMNRSYTPEEALECIRLLQSAKGDPFLGCDIITGFPGETSAEFDKTFDFCQKVGFAGIHAFPFSRRPGTEAWNFKDRITEKEAGIRAEKLNCLARMQRLDYVGRWIGREVEAIAEEGAFLSENYLKLHISSKNGFKPEAGRAYRCRILGRPEAKKEDLLYRRFDAEADIII